MKKNTLRWLAVLLAMVMLIGMLPAALADGGEDEKAVATGTAVITKTFEFTDASGAAVEPDPTCLESFSMTVSNAGAILRSGAKEFAPPTVSYDAAAGAFSATEGTITQLGGGQTGYVWTLELAAGDYLAEESGLFGYRFAGNEWTVDGDVKATDAMEYMFNVEGGTKEIQVVNRYTRRYGDIVLSKVVEGITYDQFLDTGAVFTLTGPADFNGGRPMTFSFNDDFSDHFVTMEEIRENHQGIVGYNLKTPVPNAPFGVYTVTESHADYPPYELTVSYGDGQHGDYIYILKKDAKSASDWDETGFPPCGENQFIVGTYYEMDYYLTSGKIVVDTYDTYGTIRVTKRFTGLKRGEFPDEFALGLLPPQMFDDSGETYRAVSSEPPYVWYNGKTGSFELGGASIGDITLQQTRDGFIWTLSGIPTGTYIIAEEPGWIPGYVWTGLQTSGLAEGEQIETDDPDRIVMIAEIELGTDDSRSITVTNSYEEAYGYVTVSKDLDGDSEPVEIPAGTTFTVRDEDGNAVASLTYADILRGDSMLMLPAGAEYTIEETGAEVEGYAVTARTELIDPYEAVIGPTPEIPVVKSAGAEPARSTVTAIGGTRFFIDEWYDEEHPIEIKFHNNYTKDFGTLTIVKTVRGLPDDMVLNGAYEFSCVVYSNDNSVNTSVRTSTFTKKTDEDGVYFESEPMELILPYGTYYTYETTENVAFYECWVNYVGSIVISETENEKEIGYNNEYWRRDDRGSLTIFAQVNPEEVEDLLADGFGFEVAGPEGFGENGKKTVLFGDMIPVTEELGFWERFLENGDWYVYSLRPNDLPMKSRDYEQEYGQGYEYTFMPAGEYTVTEVNADVNGYTRKTTSFADYFMRMVEVEKKAAADAERAAAGAGRTGSMTLTVEVAKYYEYNDPYVAYINDYVKGSDIPTPPPEPTPTPTPEPTPTPKPTPTPEPPETVDVSVVKVWHDVDDTMRPDSVSVTLLRNGEATENTATLDAAGSWKYTWTGLEKLDAEGNAYVYTVREDAVPEGYTVTYGGNAGSGLTVVNTGEGYTEVPDNETPLYGEGDPEEPLYNPYGVPGTGDGSNIFAWAGISALALAGLIVMMISRRKKEQE
ncbi:MAG: Cna B-type domain-containing protein [Clostridiales bacterium]|nr:Cna B-type domain-containing protein [Clostridiales bacterium]